MGTEGAASYLKRHKCLTKERRVSLEPAELHETDVRPHRTIIRSYAFSQWEDRTQTRTVWCDADVIARQAWEVEPERTYKYLAQRQLRAALPF